MLLKVATFNIQNGVAVTRGYWQYATAGLKYVLPHSPWALEGVCTFVERETIDVLMLNEAEGGSFRSHEINYVRWIADRTDLKEQVFLPTFRRALGKKALSNQGNGILSRFPLTSHDNHRLPGRGEPRYLGEALVQAPSTSITVFTTHLSLNNGERRDQLEAISKIVAARGGPRVLAGDLNTSDLNELKPIEDAGLKRLETGPTFPSWTPRRCLDHAFASDGCLRPSAAVISEVMASDHLPVLVTLTLHDD